MISADFAGSEMLDDRAFRYQQQRMLVVSIAAEVSSSSQCCDVPGGRSNNMSASANPLESSKTRIICPVNRPLSSVEQKQTGSSFALRIPVASSSGSCSSVAISTFLEGYGDRWARYSGSGGFCCC